MRTDATTPSPTRARSSSRRLTRARLVHAVGLALGGAWFAFVVGKLDLARLGALVASSGPRGLVVLVPTVAGVLFHALAWRFLLGDGLARVSVARLATVHLAAEALRVTLPGGAAFGELAAARGVRALGVSWKDAVTSLLQKRACLVATNGLWLLGLATCATRRSASGRHASDVSAAGLLAMLVVLAVALVAAGALALALIDSTPVERRLSRLSTRPHAVDPGSRPSGVVSGGVLIGAALLLAQWAADASETWLALRVVAIDASPLDAALVEGVGGLARAAAFFVPAGLGVQDASYLSVARWLDLDTTGAAAAALVVLKRTKDLCVVGAGLVAAAWLALVTRGEVPIEVQAMEHGDER